MESFVAAISHSRINSLSLAFNGTLRDQFLSSLRYFYPPSRYLRNITLSGIDYTLNEVSVPYAALRLLTLSRVLMLYTSCRQSPPASVSYTSRKVTPLHTLHEEFQSSDDQSTCMPVSDALSTVHWQAPSPISPNSVSPSWRSLPVELQLQIIRYTAPLLSFARVIRVANYAADPKTLPRDDSGIGMIRVEHWLNVVQCASG
jgi:hypothetical protein